MRFRWKGKTFWPDLGAERIIAAEREAEKIAVEIKSFTEPIVLHEFYEAIGQYEVYNTALKQLDRERKVVLAIPENIWSNLNTQEFVTAFFAIKSIPYFVYNFEKETIEQWIK